MMAMMMTMRDQNVSLLGPRGGITVRHKVD